MVEGEAKTTRPHFLLPVSDDKPVISENLSPRGSKMKFKKVFCSILAALIALSMLDITRADEGMWPFNNVPRAEIKRRYGFEVTDGWLKKVQLASVRFNNGGSGSFVSADGLVMTNHHIASDTLQKISAAEKDYLKEGFYARTRAEEIKAPDLELNVLVGIEDVTDRVQGAVKPEMSAADAASARRAETAAIEKESRQQTGLRSDVVTLYQGGRYNLYRYKVYTDVRLVFAPELDTAFFGGDPDNFNFPRFDLDMAFFRVYENGQPMRTENYFKWSKAGAKEGDLVFVSGHPGSTARLNTVAHLEYLRDAGLPFTLRLLGRERQMLNLYSARGEEQARRAQEELLSIENSLKAYQGQYEGLKDSALIRKKLKDEQALRQKIAADPRKQKQYGEAWDAIARGRKDLTAYFRQYTLLERGAGLNSSLFQVGRTLVRLAYESARPDAERLPEYTDARRPSLEMGFSSPAPVYEDFEKFALADSLSFLRDELGADDATVKTVLAGKSPAERAAELIDGTKLKDLSYRKHLAAGGIKAIEESSDPMIRLARSIDEQARALRKRYEIEVQSNERTNYARIARALFETEGDRLYPDATFTLRLSYGAVKGYEERGRWIAPFTSFAGLYERADKFANKPPYKLPQRWVEKKSSLDLRAPFNFATTNDIIGGNSGSPVINKNAEIVGLIFDGNIYSLVGNFVYDQTQNRAVAVDSRGMIEALRKVYDARELADELTR
jgi:hypothetical protein